MCAENKSGGGAVCQSRGCGVGDAGTHLCISLSSRILYLLLLMRFRHARLRFIDSCFQILCIKCSDLQSHPKPDTGPQSADSEWALRLVSGHTEASFLDTVACGESQEGCGRLERPPNTQLWAMSGGRGAMGLWGKPPGIPDKPSLTPYPTFSSSSCPSSNPSHLTLKPSLPC